MKYQLRDYQKQASDAAVRAFNGKAKRNGLLILPTGCHAKGTKILMYDGTFKNVEDILVGDVLVGDDGTPRRVFELHRGYDEMYRIIPIKGESFVVNGGHILSLYKTNEGNKYLCDKPRYDEITVCDYVAKSKNYKHLHKLHRCGYVDFGKSEYLFDPYFLGLYLGDGCCIGGIGITTQRDEVVEYLRHFASHYGLTACNKFIPLKYKTGTREQRLSLLAGLLDTDAFYDTNKNMFEYCSKSKQLADDVVFVCRSLGFFAQIGKTKIVKGQSYYRIQISGELNLIPTKVAIRKGRARKQKKNVLVTGFDVEYVGQGEYYGFTVDCNHLYLDSQFFVHHNSGKSLIIADIASRLDCPLLVFQPSKEILEQNFAKLQSYGVFDCGVYSASAGSKDINRITFATIGSVMNHVGDFARFRNILIDECHLTNANGGQYKEFIEAQDRRVVGLTATPYRLGQGFYGMSMLKFLTRTRPRIFDDVLYYCQVSDLLAKGFLADLRYFDCTTLDMSNVKTNSTGADYDDESLKLEYERSGFYDQLTSTTMRVLKPKNGVPRNGVLVFTRFTKEADELVLKLRSIGVNAAIVTGNTKKVEREGVLDAFKRGDIKVVANVGVLTTGFDYPALDTVILARPTKSLSLYYQMVGRAIRPCAGKDGWVIDLGGNYKRFGKVSDLKIDVEVPGSARWCVKSNGKQLTNVMF